MQITLTLDIPDEVISQAQARGLTPEGYLEQLVAADSNATSERPRRDLNAFFEAMTVDSSKIPQLPDEAFTRDSFYQDHD